MKKSLTLLIVLLMSTASFATENPYRKARTLQREGKHPEAIEAFKQYLIQPIDDTDITDQELAQYTEALMQLMNTYQSKGDPDECIEALQEVHKASPILQGKCLRDYYSVMGYALSRTERMKEAEETMLKALTLPLHRATPERYFRDYAYTAAVFYSNPDYQDEVIGWCLEALAQAEKCSNTSGKQWVTAMLGLLYKRDGQLNKALELYKQSAEQALSKHDELGALNSLHTLIDLFLYWGLPEYADRYADEALLVERDMAQRNPMVSSQTYINKGRALHALGRPDSIAYYTGEALRLCQSLPYNSGMADVDLLLGICYTELDDDSLQVGIEALERVSREATPMNRAKAYHQLAQTYLKSGHEEIAEAMLDSMYALLGSPTSFALDYTPILSHYLKAENHDKVEQYVRLMLQEQQALKARRLGYDLVETIVNLQAEQKRQQLRIVELHQAYIRLWLIVGIALTVIILSGIMVYLFQQKKKHKTLISQANERLSSLTQELNQSNAEKEKREQEIRDFLKDKDNRQELETLTPAILQTEGETKFRQCFEILHPLFLPRLREKVPSITRREELLSMLILLKQDNKYIAELMSIAPRSVLMMRHRFRQKIGLDSELSLENFIEELQQENDEMEINHDEKEINKDESDNNTNQYITR